MTETTTRRGTCDECGYSGSFRALELHSCAIVEQGGRCEDFPACGHTDGDGCQTLPEHTSDYWMEVMRRQDDLEWGGYNGE